MTSFPHSLVLSSQPRFEVIPSEFSNLYNFLINERIFMKLVAKCLAFVTLRLHYVPGDHGSPKRSAPCDLVNFCLGTQVLLSTITFRHGLLRYPLQTVG